MATVPDSEFRPRAQSSSYESLIVCGVLLLLAAGLVWSYLGATAPSSAARADAGRAELVETRPTNAKKDANTAGTLGQQDEKDRQPDVPVVRLSSTSDADGHLHGTVYNDTGKTISRLRLRVTTAKWADRAFDVRVRVENNATASFSFLIGEPGLRVTSFQVLGQGG